MSPASFRQITLLDVAGKMFAKSILLHLRDWAFGNGFLPAEQPAFRKHSGTLDNITALQTLIKKYLMGKGIALYTAFIDFSTEFDHVDRGTL